MSRQVKKEAVRVDLGRAVLDVLARKGPGLSTLDSELRLQLKEDKHLHIDDKIFQDTLNRLLGEFLIRPISITGTGTAFMWIPTEQARALQAMSAESSRATPDKDNTAKEALLCYKIIEAHLRDGIWTKTLKQRTNLSAGKAFQKATKLLESKKLIKSFVSIESKYKKMFIVNDLEPADRHVGGVWYDSKKEFDSSFVHTVSQVVIKLLGEHGALTAHELGVYVAERGVLKDAALSDTDVLQLLQALTYEARVEEDDDHGYHLAPPDLFPPTPFAMAPCGQCPLQDVCGKVPEVSPRTCPYLRDWLGW